MNKIERMGDFYDRLNNECGLSLEKGNPNPSPNLFIQADGSVDPYKLEQFADDMQASLFKVEDDMAEMYRKLDNKINDIYAVLGKLSTQQSDTMTEQAILTSTQIEDILYLLREYSICMDWILEPQKFSYMANRSLRYIHDMQAEVKKYISILKELKSHAN